VASIPGVNIIKSAVVLILRYQHGTARSYLSEEFHRVDNCLFTTIYSIIYIESDVNSADGWGQRRQQHCSFDDRNTAVWNTLTADLTTRQHHHPTAASLTSRSSLQSLSPVERTLETELLVIFCAIDIWYLFTSVSYLLTCALVTHAVNCFTQSSWCPNFDFAKALDFVIQKCCASWLLMVSLVIHSIVCLISCMIVLSKLRYPTVSTFRIS